MVGRYIHCEVAGDRRRYLKKKRRNLIELSVETTLFATVQDAHVASSSLQAPNQNGPDDHTPREVQVWKESSVT